MFEIKKSIFSKSFEMCVCVCVYVYVFAENKISEEKCQTEERKLDAKMSKKFYFYRFEIKENNKLLDLQGNLFDRIGDESDDDGIPTVPQNDETNRNTHNTSNPRRQVQTARKTTQIQTARKSAVTTNYRQTVIRRQIQCLSFCFFLCFTLFLCLFLFF